jgi:hypothetical protein
MEDCDLINEYRTAPGGIPTDRLHLSHKENFPMEGNLSLFEKKVNQSVMPAPFSHYAGSNLK